MNLTPHQKLAISLYFKISAFFWLIPVLIMCFVAGDFSLSLVLHVLAACVFPFAYAGFGGLLANKFTPSIVASSFASFLMSVLAMFGAAVVQGVALGLSGGLGMFPATVGLVLFVVTIFGLLPAVLVGGLYIGGIRHVRP